MKRSLSIQLKFSHKNLSALTRNQLFA